MAANHDDNIIKMLNDERMQTAGRAIIDRLGLEPNTSGMVDMYMYSYDESKPFLVANSKLFYLLAFTRFDQLIFRTSSTIPSMLPSSRKPTRKTP